VRGKTAIFSQSSQVKASGPEEPAARNVDQIAKLEREQVHNRSLTERIAATITRAAGTATFALAHVAWFVGWIAVNAGLLRRVRPFDPFPFNLLTMIVSLEAIFLSIWILISQNHMSRQADRRAHLDLQVNLLAEQESTATLRLVRQLAAHLGLQVSESDDSLVDETDVEHLAAVMDDALPETTGTSAAAPPAPLPS
jgi:uncharacterized membrane protein